MILFYVPFASQANAEEMTIKLLHHKLVACAHYFPITAHLFWTGQEIKPHETVAIFKTNDTCAPAAERFITANHPYDIPCVLSFTVKANPEYEAWVDETVTEGSVTETA